jgi:hypothetical protein
MYGWKQVYYLQGLCYVNDVRVKAGVFMLMMHLLKHILLDRWMQLSV